MALGVVGGVGLPAASQDAAPGASEGAQRAAVFVAAGSGLGIMVAAPGFQRRVVCARVPSALRRRLLHAQRNLAFFRFAGLDRHRRLAGVGGDRGAVRVAKPAVADL